MAKVHLFVICKELGFLRQESGIFSTGELHSLHRPLTLLVKRLTKERKCLFQSAVEEEDHTGHCVFALNTNTGLEREEAACIYLPVTTWTRPLEKGAWTLLLDCSPGPGSLSHFLLVRNRINTYSYQQNGAVPSRGREEGPVY